MRCTIPKLIDSMPATPRTFRAMKTLKQAFALVAKCGEERAPKLRKVEYGDDPRDVRFIVNYYGSNKRERIQVARQRVLVWNGICMNRLLPVVRDA